MPPRKLTLAYVPQENGASKKFNFIIEGRKVQPPSKERPADWVVAETL